MIPQETIAHIIEEADLAEIIGDYIPLQKKGQNYWALCPFHDDKSPSFSVNSEKRIYKCFSCGVQGNIIDFVKNYTHSEFLTALEIISTKIDFPIPELKNRVVNSKYSSEEEKLFSLNEKALQFYQVVLASQEGLAAQEYLTKRGFNQEEMMYWEIGWASSKISFYKTMLSQNEDLELLRSAGLVTLKDGQVFDYFVNRLVFPIKNQDGKILGFSGRTINEQTPKYLNTRETKLFKKSQLAFNLDMALPSITISKKILVLEGFMDVMSLHQIGVKNAIALMGTNLSEFHLQLFKKLKVEVLLFLDGDLPGVKASLTSAKKLLNYHLPVQIIDNETKLDPDDLVHQGQSETLWTMLNNPQIPLFYAIEKIPQLVNLQKPELFREYLNRVFDFLLLVTEPVLKAQGLQKLSQKTNLTTSVLGESYEKFRNNLSGQELPRPPVVTITTTKRKPKTFDKQPDAYDYSQRDILQSLISSPRHLEKIARHLGGAPNPDLYIVLQELINGYQNGTYHANNWEELMAILQLSNFDYQNPFWQLEPHLQANWHVRSNLDSAILTLQEHHLIAKEKLYAQQIRETDVVEVQKKFLKVKEEIHQEIIDLRKKRQ
ncbi:DNA primase [Entomoplasma freundtii]|uniref:DNA primase n=1 Tax=Entomoplasma freundtii TaxID=74700 RepID=A0A2K8NUT1_9MOLU|nr:DNA primase [Entomoplasma freundtii]TDY56578.1 DNA primase [Entomoplasma freundtii]